MPGLGPTPPPFQRRVGWEPLLPAGRSAPGTVQKEPLVYTDVAEDAVLELRGSLEREVRVRFDQSRPYGIPEWNVLASRALREALVELVERPEREPDLAERLRELGPGRWAAVGFWRGFSGKQRLLDDVLGTQVHVNAGPFAQFALAVHVKPFFNNLVCCAVALAHLQD